MRLRRTPMATDGARGEAARASLEGRVHLAGGAPVIVGLLLGLGLESGSSSRLLDSGRLWAAGQAMVQVDGLVVWNSCPSCHGMKECLVACLDLWSQVGRAWVVVA